MLFPMRRASATTACFAFRGARDTRPRCGLTDTCLRSRMEGYSDGGGLGGGGGDGGSDSDDGEKGCGCGGGGAGDDSGGGGDDSGGCRGEDGGAGVGIGVGCGVVVGGGGGISVGGGGGGGGGGSHYHSRRRSCGPSEAAQTEQQPCLALSNARALSDESGQCDHGTSCGARDTRPRCGLTDACLRSNMEAIPGRRWFRWWLQRCR